MCECVSAQLIEELDIRSVKESKARAGYRVIFEVVLICSS